MSTLSLSEQRKFVRVPAGIEAEYRSLALLTPPKLGLTRDISLGGMRFAAPEKLSPGELIGVSLELASNGTISMTGEVLWTRQVYNGDSMGYESGVCWSKMDKEEASRLNEFVSGFADSNLTPTMVSTTLIPEEPLVVWPRALAIAFGAFALIASIAGLWLNQVNLEQELKGAKFAISSYELQIDQLTRQY